MARTIDWIDRVSESFDKLDSMTQADMVSELFSRLGPLARASVQRRIELRVKLDASIEASREEAHNGE